MTKIDNGKLKILPLTESSIETQVNLYNEVFEEGMSIDDWRYRYFPCGNNVKAQIWGAYYEDELVGINGFVEQNFRVNKKIFTGIQSGNSAVKPEYQGNGVFKSIIRMAEDYYAQKGFDFLFGFPGVMSYNEFIKLGWIEISKTRMMVLPCSIEKVIYKRYGLRTPRVLDLILEMLWIKTRRNMYGSNSIEILSYISFPFSSDECAKINMSDTMVTSIRSREYVDWRTNNVRGCRYFLVYEKEKLVAYFICTISHTSVWGDYVDVTDWWSEKGKSDILMNGMAQKFIEIKKDISMIGVAAPITPEYNKVFTNLGFLQLGKSATALLIRPLNDTNILKYVENAMWEIKGIDVFM